MAVKRGWGQVSCLHDLRPWRAHFSPPSRVHALVTSPGSWWDRHPGGPVWTQEGGGHGWSRARSTDLSHGPLGPEEAAQEVEGHTQHGGKREGPAHGFAPPRVHVGVVVDQWLVVDHVEDEDALRVREACNSPLANAASWPLGALHPARPSPLPCTPVG